MHPVLIPLLLLIVPVAEIAVFILVGGRIGIIATLGLVMVTAVIGSVLLRVQGLATLQRIRLSLEEGRLPGRELGNGAMILAAGILLLTPGFVTDSLGFILFVPAAREALWRFLASHFIVTRFGPTGEPGAKRPQDGVVDLGPGEFSENPDPNSPWRDSGIDKK